MNTFSYVDLIQCLKKYFDELDQGLPKTMKGFGSLSKAAMEEGSLDKKTKELLALVISITAHVEGGIAFHIKALVELETTRKEILETLAVTIYMGGGRNLMYAAEALRAYDELSKIT